ncbi:MAG TPA: SurA N-terminal domain-containing protein, partial [Pontiella sp.]|nr:SurA N-terminal domain-containing protein [Pontiella sp.]
MAMMISKFHKLIQSKVVWTAFAILISVAFVTVYTGSKSSARRARSENEQQIAGRLYGEDISRQEYGQAYRNVYVMYTLMAGRMINIDEQMHEMLSEAAWQRLAILKKAQQMGMTVSKEQTIARIEKEPLFQNQQTGGFDRSIFDSFVNAVLPRMQMTAAGFENLMLENVLIDKASIMATQGALVTDAEVRKTFHLVSDKLTVQYAAIPRTLSPAADVTEDEAKAYYEDFKAEFMMPEKVSVRYVQYPVADYTEGVLVTDDMVSAFYENYKQRYVKPAAEDAPEGTPPEYQPLEEVRDSITEMLTTALAQREAINAADGLVAQLADESVTFDRAAEQAGLAIIGNIPPFAPTDMIKGIDPTAPFAQAAFTLENDPSHYYSDPVPGREYVYVIALERRLPAFLPGYDVVREDVIEAAKTAAAERAYITLAETIHSEIETALKGGASFADAASRQKLNVETTGPFSAAAPPDME